MTIIDVCGDGLTLALSESGDEGLLALALLGLDGHEPWTADAGAALPFRIDVCGHPVSARTRAVRWEAQPGWKECVVSLDAGGDLAVEHHTRRYEGEPVVEQWQVVRNAGRSAVELTRLDSLVVDLRTGRCDALWFESAWGAEFAPRREPLRGDLVLESRAGRSSNGMHPWLALWRADGEILVVSPAWSGNWVLRLERLDDGTRRLSGGLHDWAFSRVLGPGDALATPPVVLAAGSDDLDSASVALGRVGRRHWYPRSAVWDGVPLEWNHWWPYEDAEIDEATFLANVERAAALGVEVCTLDAGWFGAGGDWVSRRGDWDVVDARRFPNGIRPLADAVHGRGMRFGLWCEIEAIGPGSELARRRPELLAMRDGESLGYLCLGAAAGRTFALNTLDRLVREHGCDWLKIDFNVDPGAGCDRVGHGHGPGAGLFEHVRGLYAVLDALRERHPDLVLEACSSGGLRIDLGLARHTHVTFLSDPDWPEHALQVLWGATTMLAPRACLHWSFSQWRGDHPRQDFDPAAVDERHLRGYLRMAMLTGFGVSLRLPDLPPAAATVLAEEIALFRREVAPFVADGDLRHLTGQPLRDGGGERCPAFQLSLAERDEHLLFAFRLDGAPPAGHVRLKGLDPNRNYAVSRLDGGADAPLLLGAALMGRGLDLDHLAEGESAVLRLT